MGRALSNNLINLDLLEDFREAVGELDADLEELMGEEPDAALGNGIIV